MAAAGEIGEDGDDGEAGVGCDESVGVDELRDLIGIGIVEEEDNEEEEEEGDGEAEEEEAERWDVAASRDEDIACVERTSSLEVAAMVEESRLLCGEGLRLICSNDTSCLVVF